MPPSGDVTTYAALDAELADLRRKLAKRLDQAGFARNVLMLRERIAQLEAMREAMSHDGG